MLLSGSNSFATGINAITSSTSSICNNDGRLTVTASGGTGPYTYQLTAGPSNPSISYPVSIPFGNNTFINLPSGSYTIVVTDAIGNTATISGTVGGNYQFPNMLLDTLTPTMIIAYAADGRPPYQFALSMTSANSGFGPYQYSDSFTHLCPGVYWVRVRDSCQNIFTNQAFVSYGLQDSFSCINFSKGHMSVVASGGNAPYTYTFGSTTNTTGVFTGLPAYFSNTLTITDSCGVQFTTAVGPSPMGFFEICPFDSNLYINGSQLPTDNTLTFVCTDCTPAQTVVSTSLSPTGTDVVFQHIQPNQNYHIVITGTACGGDTFQYTITRPAPTFFTIGSAPLSCNSFEITSTYSFDSVILRNSAGVIIGISRPGTFFHLPDGTYTATAYTHSSASACFSGDSSKTDVTTPFFPPTCEAMTKDSACNSKWELIVASDASLYDSYSLIYRPGDTVVGDVNPSYYAFFYNLDPGTYTLLSDSGCAQPVTLGPMPTFTSTAVSYLPCVGPPTISVNINPPGGNTCATFQSFQLLKDDTLYHYRSAPDGSLIVADSGLYKVRWYISSFDADGRPFPYNALCPIDSNLIYVSTSHVPTPASNSAYVCTTQTQDSVHFDIYGGFIPYTVEIPGFDTLLLQTNSGNFPTNIPGQYSMIVYDNCGVSRSVTFSIIDTCTGCPNAIAAATDSLFCAGDTVRLKDLGTGAVTYQWLINGAPYSISRDTFFIATAGSFDVFLRAYSRSGCEDSTRFHFNAVSPYSINLGPDTSYCDTFSKVLSTGIASTVWSTGQTGAQITVDSPGRYWAMVFNKCGAHTDTIELTSNIVSGLTLIADQNTICNDKPDTVLLHASVDSISRSAVTFVWSSGQVDSPFYSTILWAYSAATYTVTAQDGQCFLTKNITLTAMRCDSTDTTVIVDTTCIHKIAVPDIFSPNSDDKNEVFHVLHTCPVSSFNIHIYNRWGMLVFESADIDQGWDGNFRGVAQPSEVYMWFACVKAKGSTKENCTTGTVTLVR